VRVDELRLLLGVCKQLDPGLAHQADLYYGAFVRVDVRCRGGDLGYLGWVEGEKVVAVAQGEVLVEEGLGGPGEAFVGVGWRGG